MVAFLSEMIRFVLYTTAKRGIDESHGVGHSLNALRYASYILADEISYPSISPSFPPDILIRQKPVVYAAAVLHDMCDKKYMNETDGVKAMTDFIGSADVYSAEETRAIADIVSTMSYSTVKKYGYPSLGKYQTAYHIVREADLLCAYDFDRSIIYHLSKTVLDDPAMTLTQAYANAKDLFHTRVLRHNQDGLFLSNYARRKSMELHTGALYRMRYWDNMMKTSIKLI